MLSTSLIYGLAGMISQFFQYITLPIFSKNMTPGQFGSVSVLESVMFLSIVFISFSIERAAQRFFFDKKHDSALVFSAALFWLVANGAACLIFSLILEAVGLTAWLPIKFGLSMMVLTALGAGISGLASVYFQVQQKPILFCGLNFIKGVGQFLLAYYLVSLLNMGVYGYVFSILITNLIMACFSIYLLPKVSANSIDISLIKEMLVFSLPFVPTVIGAWALTMGGRFFLQSYATLGDVGVYSFWYKISLAYFLCSAAINTALSPVIYKSLAAGVTERELIKNMARPLFRTYGLGAIAFVLISNECGRIMGGNGYSMSSALFSLMVVGHFLSSVMGGWSDLMLSYNKFTKLQMLTFLAGGGISIAMNFIVTPAFGIVGVILSTFSSLVFIISCHFLILKAKKLPSFNYLEVAGWVLGIIGAGLLTAYIDQLNWQLGYLVRFGFAGLALIMATMALYRMKGSETNEITPN